MRNIIKIAIPHVGIKPSPDDVTYIAGDGEIMELPYDWMVEYLQEGSSPDMSKVESSGWNPSAFNNFKSWINSKPLYKGKTYKELIDMWSNGVAPVWNRIDPDEREPIGWYDFQTGSYIELKRRNKIIEKPKDNDDIIFEPDKNESHAVAWVDKSCGFKKVAMPINSQGNPVSQQYLDEREREKEYLTDIKALIDEYKEKTWDEDGAKRFSEIWLKHYPNSKGMKRHHDARG